MAHERLQKLIAQAGVCSRRKAELLISDGRVRVNGKVVKTLGTQADPDHDKIEVDGRRLSFRQGHRYFVLHKPAGYVTSASDEFGRQTVFELIKGVDTRLFTVGRLDLNTEGLLILTNDGATADALTHPSGRVAKTYQVKVRGKPALSTIEKLQQGVLLEDGPAVAEEIFFIQPGQQVSERNTWLQLTVREGRNRLVRRLCEHVGHPVIRLRRIGFGPLSLDRGLREGNWRPLNKEEIRKLKALGRVAARRRQGAREEAAELAQDWEQS